MFPIPVAKSALCTLLVTETADVKIAVEGTDGKGPTSVCWEFSPLPSGTDSKRARPTPARIGIASPPGAETTPMMAAPLRISPMEISISGFSTTGKGHGPSYSGQIEIVLYLWADLGTAKVKLFVDGPIEVKFCFGDDTGKLATVNPAGTFFQWNV